jgi:hypothetical protein
MKKYFQAINSHTAFVNHDYAANTYSIKPQKQIGSDSLILHFLTRISCKRQPERNPLQFE